MLKRQVVLKINTSGSSIQQGNRIVEIDGIELMNGRPTRKRFHRYINPNRIIESAAFNQHGLSYHFLRKHPMFGGIARDFLDFIFDTELLIENSAATVKFINREFDILGWQPLESYCQITSANHPAHANARMLIPTLAPIDAVLPWC